MQSDTLKTYTKTNEKVTAIKENDETVMKLFYQENYPKVETYVLNNNGSADEAKDIYQEAFIAMWRNIQLGRFQLQGTTSLDGYIYQIAKNKWLDQLRSQKRRQVVSLTEETHGLEDEILLSEYEQEKISSIKTNLKLLADSCRDLLERFYYRKQSMRKISEDMKWTEATAKNNKYRCLQRLRDLIKTTI